MLCGKDRMRLDPPLDHWRAELIDRGLREIPVDGEIGIRAAGLSDVDGDPADRIIVATALAAGTLVTADRNLLEWKGRLKRIEATG